MHRECLIDGCQRSAAWKNGGRGGMCVTHYQRWRKTGVKGGSIQTWWHALPPAERLELQTDRSGGPEACWPWTGALTDGYAHIQIDGAQIMAHRFAYELAYGPISEDLDERLTIDHTCLNSACMNHRHMEVVTMRVNVLRSNNPAAINARKTHCPRGHPYDDANTYMSKGKRYCRICLGLDA